MFKRGNERQIQQEKDRLARLYRRARVCITEDWLLGIDCRLSMYEPRPQKKPLRQDYILALVSYLVARGKRDALNHMVH